MTRSRACAGCGNAGGGGAGAPGGRCLGHAQPPNPKTSHPKRWILSANHTPCVLDPKPYSLNTKPLQGSDNIGVAPTLEISDAGLLLEAGTESGEASQVRLVMSPEGVRQIMKFTNQIIFTSNIKAFV